MAIYDYQIGANTENMEYVENKIDSICTGHFERWPVKYTGANGKTYGDGLPKAVWRFDLISQTDLNTLREYWEDNNVYLPSNEMAIRTRLDDGTFATFDCIGHWPNGIENKRIPGNFYRDVEIEYTQLVYVADPEPDPVP